MACRQEEIDRYCGSNQLIRRSDQIAKLGTDCKTGYYGWLDIWPFKYIQRDSYTCSRLLSLKPENVDYVPVDKQLKRFLNDIVGLPHVEFTNYEGFVESGLYALLYLLRRNQSECIILSNFGNLVTNILETPTMKLREINWSDIGLQWYWQDGEYQLQFPGTVTEANYINAIQNCVTQKSRFIINLITLVHRHTQMHHANILLYDSHTHILERFEPYQVQLTGYNLHKFDERLQNIYQKADPDFFDFIGPPDVNFFLRHGIQQIQEEEGEQKYAGQILLDPEGFCQPWTILYADIRMSFPDQAPESIPTLLKQWVKTKNISLTTFIRNYSEHLYQINETIYQRYIRQNHKFVRFQDKRVVTFGLIIQQLRNFKTVYI